MSSGKTVEAATDRAQKLVRAQFSEAVTSAFVEDSMFFLTAEVTDGDEKRSASHAYTLDSTKPAELQEAAEDLAKRVTEELQ
ncbi:hypothetical protein [Agrococcus casei]|uniref:hypothetical protein n=1 Tax=Agrococcus casei TaxID=343512 RepID=UPI003F8E5F58